MEPLRLSTIYQALGYTLKE